MAIKSIIKTPNKILETPTNKVSDFGEQTKKTGQDLKDTLAAATNPGGAGIAAPQIGVKKQICIANDYAWDSENEKEVLTKTYVLINPKVISSSKETQTDWEGCLSIPNVYGKVERSKKIKVKAKDENGQKIRITASGFLARVIQHEIDHLNGILFTSKVKGQTVTEQELDEMEPQL